MWALVFSCHKQCERIEILVCVPVCVCFQTTTSVWETTADATANANVSTRTAAINAVTAQLVGLMTARWAAKVCVYSLVDLPDSFHK